MDLLQRTASWFSEKNIDNARREAEWIFAHCLSLSRLELYTSFDMPLSAEQVSELRACVARRGKREPLAYILGTQPFHGLDLVVSPAVLVPRPETEELVDWVLEDIDQVGDGARVIDVGTGSGAIALALAHARPGCAVHAVDVSADALAVARANKERLGLSVQLQQSDLLDAVPAEWGARWDVIVANLPYIAEHERNVCDPELAHEPQVALFAANDGLALIERLIAVAPQQLSDGGVL